MVDAAQCRPRAIQVLLITAVTITVMMNGHGQPLTQEQVSGSASPIYLSPASVRLIQQTLNRQGFDAGPVDGIWGELTRGAVQAYQRSHTLEPTGTPTVSFIAALGIAIINREPEQMRDVQDQQWVQEYTRGPGKPLYLSPARVRQTQKTLAELGHDPGEIDGIWGAATRMAAGNFQRTRGLEPTGMPTLDLLAALGLNVWSSPSHSDEQSWQWKQEAATGPGTVLRASPALVRRIQLMLAKDGFDPGEISGIWDSRTAKAARNYQRTHGLEPTGTLTTELLRLSGSALPTEIRK
ncbi:peptidoglycan-binding protein [Proteobacteria bacterium 005FR1]|nr:peptidoglycan-binding protein [Proteobacteria bacterium 005FR1]